MKQKVCVTGFIVISIVVMAVFSSIQGLSAAEKKKQLRVGVYDSRGIAIAYANSEYWNKILKEKQAALEQAKKEGNTEKVKEIEAWGPAHQAAMHLQGFGTAPVHECFEPVKDKIADVAKQAGVDVIVSKWECDYMAPESEVVDVTLELAKLFNPQEKAYQWIDQLKDHAPIRAEDIEKLEKEDPDF